MSRFTENLILIMSLAFMVWLWLRRGEASINQVAAQANNTAPFWFTAPDNARASTFDFASQPNY